MSLLDELIREEIRACGPLRFDRFMELALYQPEHGYYAKPRRIGRTGDFYTSVSVGPLFGRMLAWQARQMAERLAEPVFTIVEQGAHDGQLACDILEEIGHSTDFAARLRYVIIEPNAQARAAQESQLAKFAGRVNWRENLEEKQGESPCGLFLSNELVDALPVRLIQAETGTWRERRVGVGRDGSLVWTLAPMDEALERAVTGLPLAPVDGYRTEIGMAARDWMRAAAGFLRRGYLLTIDYGFPASVYYAPERRDGTLTCYREHRRGDNVLEAPGQQDITAHVDFSALARVGREAGWETLGLTDQQRFLTALLQEHSTTLEPKDVRAFQTLTHPAHLGTRFLALAQAKDAPRDLMGLKFARDWQMD